jgi:hypothetical protein
MRRLACSTDTDLTAEMVMSKYGTDRWPAFARCAARNSAISVTDA